MTTTSTGDGAWTSVVGAVDISDDVVIAHDVTLDGNVDMTGNLTINSGKSLDTTGSDHNLTVDGLTEISGTLTCNGSDITLGSGKSTAFAVVVLGGGTFNGGSGTHTYGSLNVNSSATLYAFSSGTTTLNGKSNTTRIFSTSATDRITAAGTLEIATSQTPVDIRCDDDTGINNLTMNSSSKILHLINHRGSGNSNPLVIGGDLNITAGTVSTRNVEDTLDYGLTVTGALDVGASGALTCNSSAVQCNGLRTTGGTVNLPDASGSFTVKGTEFSGYGIYDRVGSGNIVHNSGTITWDTGGMSTLYALSTFNNITTTTSGTTLRWFSALTLAGDLTVAANTNVNEHASAGGAFTVGGDVDVSGTLGNSDAYSAYEFGSLTIASGGTYSATSGTTTITSKASSNFAFKNEGTFTHNSGTMQIGDGSTSTGGAHLMNTTYHNLIINRDQNAPDGNTPWRPSSGSEVTIAGDLTVTKGRFYRNNSSNSLVVTGLVLIEANGQVGTDAATGSNTFGSLGIDTGGTYLATSGTTTITTGGTVLGQSATALTGNGTFTHNNGTLVFDSTQYRIPSGGTFYNVKMTGSHSTDGLYGFGGNLLPQAVMPDGSTESNAVSILGTLEITDDEFRPYNINKIYVHNLVIGDGTGSANSAKFDLSALDVFDGEVYVDNVTIHSDGQFLFGDGDEPQSSTLNVYGAFRNLGGSVDIV